MSPQYKPIPRVEQVMWLDHFSNHSHDVFTLHQIASRVKEDFVSVTVGMLVYEDDRLLVLAHEGRVDVDIEEPLFSHYTAIYKVCILERQVLAGAHV